MRPLAMGRPPLGLQTLTMALSHSQRLINHCIVNTHPVCFIVNTHLVCFTADFSFMANWNFTLALTKMLQLLRPLLARPLSHEPQWGTSGPRSPIESAATALTHIQKHPWWSKWSTDSYWNSLAVTSMWYCFQASKPFCHCSCRRLCLSISPSSNLLFRSAYIRRLLSTIWFISCANQSQNNLHKHSES